MTKFWDWLKTGWKWVVAVLIALVAAAAGAGWLWERRASRLGAVQDEETVRKARERIAELNGARAEVAQRVGEDDDLVRSIDEQLLANKRAIIEAHAGGAGLTDEQVLDEFRRLGY